MLNFLLGFLIRALITVGLLRASVGLVSPGNRHNTWGNAILAALIIHVLAAPLLWFWWVLFIPLIIYLVIWFFTITRLFRIGKGQALAVGVVGVILSWLTNLILPVN